MRAAFEIVASGAIGALGGILSGFLGMGGAAILPPLLAFALGVDQQRAQGISLAAMLPPVGLPAVIAYRRTGARIDFALVAWLVGGFVGGAPIGAWIANGVPARQLAWSFGAYLFYTAWRALFGRARSRFGHRPRSSPAWRRLFRSALRRLARRRDRLRRRNRFGLARRGRCVRGAAARPPIPRSRPPRSSGDHNRDVCLLSASPRYWSTPANKAGCPGLSSRQWLGALPWGPRPARALRDG